MWVFFSKVANQAVLWSVVVVASISGDVVSMQPAETLSRPLISSNILVFVKTSRLLFTPKLIVTTAVVAVTTV